MVTMAQDRLQIRQPHPLSFVIKRLLIVLGAVLAPFGVRAATYTFTNTTSDLENLAHGTAYTWGLTTATYNSGAPKAKNTSSSLDALETAITSGGQMIVSATLTIDNIYDWENNSLDPADVLYVNLLNGVSTGTHAYTYNADPSTSDTSFGSDPFELGTPNETVTNKHLKFDPVSSSPTATYNQDNSLLVYTGTYNTTSYKGQANPGTWSDPKGGSPTGFNLVVNLSSANLKLVSNLLTSDAGGSTDFGLGFGPDCHYYDSGVSLCITTAPQVHYAADRAWSAGLLIASLLALAALERRRFSHVA